MKKIVLTLSVIFGCLNVCKAQSFEGYISENIPVWVDLNIPSNVESISGSYFYKKNGVTILVSGTIKGNQIILTEKNKSGLITGIFTCINWGDSLIGNWKIPNSSKLLTVKLYKTDPSFKTYAKIPSADNLILSKGKTLSDELTEYLNQAGKKSKLGFTCAEKSIVSAYFDWETMGAYYSSGRIYHTFDLTINKEISLLKEIDPLKLPTLKSKMKLQIQNELDKVHKDFTEEDWINAFGDKVTYNKSFKVTAIENNLLENYYLKNGKLNILITDYFGFPSATKNMDLTFEITIPFSELDIYLKENSILNNLK